MSVNFFVSNSNTLAKSTDNGLTFSNVTGPQDMQITGYSMESFTYGSNTWAFIQNPNTPYGGVWYTPDGTSYTRINVAAKGVAYINSNWYIYRTSDLFITPSLESYNSNNNIPGPNGARNISHIGNTIVTHNSSNFYVTNDNYTTFDTIFSPIFNASAGKIEGLVAGNGLFVAAGRTTTQQQNSITWSTDGSNWNSASNGGFPFQNVGKGSQAIGWSVAFNGTTFLAGGVGSGLSNALIASTDGKSWSNVSNSYFSNVSYVTWSGAYWFINDFNNGGVAYSSNLSSWTMSDYPILRAGLGLGSAPPPPSDMSPAVLRKQPVCYDGAAEFFWQPPVSTGGSPISSYTLACPTIPFSQDVLGTFAKVSSLTNGVDYTFNLTTFNTDEVSSIATFYSVQTGGKPSPPLDTATKTLSETTATITWSTPTTDGGARIKWYVGKTQSSDSNDPVVKKCVTGYSRSMTLLGLNSNSTYDFKVYAVNDPAYSDFSYTSSFV